MISNSFILFSIEFMVMRIAVPVKVSTLEDALKHLEKISGYPDLIAEIRYDYNKNPNPEDLPVLISYNKNPKIFTVRHKSEAGHDPNAGFEGSEEERLKYLETAIKLGVQYIDIERKYYYPFEKSGNTKIIVSDHYFDNALLPEELSEIYWDMAKKGADIIKIAMAPKDYKDNLIMLNMIFQSKRLGKDMIGICMGNNGIITRILGPVYGGYLTFASLDGQTSASGQIEFQDLSIKMRRASTLYEIFKKNKYFLPNEITKEQLEIYSRALLDAA